MRICINDAHLLFQTSLPATFEIGFRCPDVSNKPMRKRNGNHLNSHPVEHGILDDFYHNYTLDSGCAQTQFDWKTLFEYWLIQVQKLSKALTSAGRTRNAFLDIMIFGSNKCFRWMQNMYKYTWVSSLYHPVKWWYIELLTHAYAKTRMSLAFLTLPISFKSFSSGCARTRKVFVSQFEPKSGRNSVLMVAKPKTPYLIQCKKRC